MRKKSRLIVRNLWYFHVKLFSYFHPLFYLLPYRLTTADGKNEIFFSLLKSVNNFFKIKILFCVSFTVTPSTHLRREFKKWSDFHETSYTLPKGRGRTYMNFFFALSSVVSEIWVVAIWQMPARTGTKLAKIRLKIINALRE